MNEIPLPNPGKLYISSLYDLSEINKNNISVVISLCPVFQKLNHVIHYSYSVLDLPNSSNVEKMKAILQTTRSLMYLYLSNGKNVLVHCHAGISRSSTVVIDYICSYFKFPNCISQTDCVYTYVKQYRPIIQPNSGFYELLKSMYH
jgi:protein-tyrosine phosphatase